MKTRLFQTKTRKTLIFNKSKKLQNQFQPHKIILIIMFTKIKKVGRMY
jgi:hypothetical protein